MLHELSHGQGTNHGSDPFNEAFNFGYLIDDDIENWNTLKQAMNQARQNCNRRHNK